MSSSKDKAEDLVNQFRMVLMNEDTDCGEEILCSLIAMKNAIICVREIVSMQDKTTLNFQYNKEYWIDVINEINNM